MIPDAAPDRGRKLLDRVRHVLPHDTVREVRMFGVTAVVVDGAMVVAVHPDGSLLIRVDPAEDAALLERPDAARAEMGTGRSMGAGWIRVAASALETDEGLDGWLRPAVDFNGRSGAGR
ncbi:MAG: TfoX/Sxy family protein [Terracoccus sp.]